MVTKQFQSSEASNWIRSGWTRPIEPGHFQWIDAEPATRAGAQRDSDRLWLASDLAANHYVPYSPLVDEPALFRIFAECEPTAPAFLGFVNRFGPLGAREAGRRHHPGAPGVEVIIGESLTRYLSEHEAIKQVVGMLDCLNRGRGLQAHAKTIPHLLLERALKIGTVSALRQGSIDWLQGTINSHLTGAAGGDAVVVQLEYEHGRLTIQSRTRSLLGILWLQCALAAQGQTFRRCRACRKWMLIAPGVGRNKQIMYCSTLCKVRAFRKRNPTGRAVRPTSRRGAR